jgi:hypothetical protein
MVDQIIKWSDQMDRHNGIVNFLIIGVNQMAYVASFFQSDPGH